MKTPACPRRRRLCCTGRFAHDRAAGAARITASARLCGGAGNLRWRCCARASAIQALAHNGARSVRQARLDIQGDKQMSSAAGFGRDMGKLVPGFDFLQGLLKNAGSSLPLMGQWVAPTLNPEELEKRIQELKTVQFWLEQNVKILGATIQAMEVQRMTLNTLQSMNMPLADLANALKIQMPDEARSGSAAVEPSAAPMAPAAPAAPATAVGPPPPAPTAAAADSASNGASAAKKVTSAAPSVDPTQWWNALTEQFGQLASQAVHAAQNLTESGAAASRQSTVGSARQAATKSAKNPATQPATKPATQATAKAVSGSAKAARKPAKQATQTATASAGTGSRTRAAARARPSSKTPSRRAG